MVTSKKARRGTAAQPRLALTALDTVAQSRARGWRRCPVLSREGALVTSMHVCALLHGLRWIALAVGGVCPDLDAQNPRAWDRVEVAEQEGEQKDDRTRTASHLWFFGTAAATENALSESAAENTSVDDEDDFGFEIPMVPGPGPIPESYPSDDEDLDYIDSSELPDGGSGVDSDSEVPSAASPPGVDDFVADAGSSSSTAVAAPADWDRPLVPGQATRAGRKRRVYDTQYGCDLCGKVVTEAERADSELAMGTNCQTRSSRLTVTMENASLSEPQGDSDHQDGNPDELSEPEAQADTPSSQVANARSPRWQSWQDRYLAVAADQTRPFLLTPSEREDGWNRTAEVLLRDSRAVSPRSIIDRTGSACKNRFMKLMKEHKKGETASRMKTGAVEQISDHLKLMTDLQAIMDDHVDTAKESSTKLKQKADLEEKAGKELRDAAMKQGQRKRNRAPLLPSEHHNRTQSSDDENSDRRNDEDTRRLKDARRHADRQHDELLHAQNQTLGVLLGLTKEVKGMREDNRAARDGGEGSRTTQILAELVAKKF
ncbi:hypothetical protein B0H14DRAFT_3433082 [Mycena olivaceomarginata]|nr:hypothetical protein B0H14DRAFT_3433082 [Mycena olivaceomarginata]